MGHEEEEDEKAAESAAAHAAITESLAQRWRLRKQTRDNNNNAIGDCPGAKFHSDVKVLSVK